MTKVIMYGCNGFMGHVICDLIKAMNDVEVVAGIDIAPNDSYDFPVFTSTADCDVQADAIIDFSAAPAVNAALAFAVEKQIPLVECTTGLSEDQIAYLKECSGKVAVLRSANMSLGVNTLLKMVKTAAAILGNAGFDIDIVERHHRRQVDAPSGTALALADSINEGCEGRYSYVFDRSERRQQCTPFIFWSKQYCCICQMQNLVPLLFKVFLPSCPSHCWENVVITTLLKMEKTH